MRSVAHRSSVGGYAFSILQQHRRDEASLDGVYPMIRRAIHHPPRQNDAKHPLALCSHAPGGRNDTRHDIPGNTVKREHFVSNRNGFNASGRAIGHRHRSPCRQARELEVPAEALDRRLHQLAHVRLARCRVLWRQLQRPPHRRLEPAPAPLLAALERRAPRQLGQLADLRRQLAAALADVALILPGDHAELLGDRLIVCLE